MGLQGALVDRARLLTKVAVVEDATPIKVEGRVRYLGGGAATESPPGPWFAVRLTELETTEQVQDGRERLPRHAELLFSIYDEAGAPVRLRVDALIEVESELTDFAAATPLVETYQITSHPEIFRRRHGFVGGGKATIQRIDEVPDTREGD